MPFHCFFFLFLTQKETKTVFFIYPHWTTNIVCKADNVQKLLPSISKVSSTAGWNFMSKQWPTIWIFCDLWLYHTKSKYQQCDDDSVAPNYGRHIIAPFSGRMELAVKGKEPINFKSLYLRYFLIDFNFSKSSGKIFSNSFICRQAGLSSGYGLKVMI